MLAFLGYDPGQVDGKPDRARGPPSWRSRGAEPTGEADAGLLAALNADAMRAFGHNRIADVRVGQRILGVRGFDTGGVDGLVGPRTKAAIMALQRTQQGAPSADATDATLLGALLAER